MSDENGWRTPGSDSGMPSGAGAWPPPQSGSSPADGAWTHASGGGWPAGATAPTGGTGWAPPPKPGLIPLRPLSFGTLISAPFQTLKRNPRATFGSALLIQGLILLVSLLVVGGVTAFATSRVAMAEGPDVDTVAAGAVAGILASALVPVALSIVGAALLQGVIVLEVARATLGEKLSLRSLWSRARRRLAALVGWVLLLGAATLVAIGALVAVVALLVALGPLTTIIGVFVAIIGGVGLIVLGAWLFTKTSLVPSAIVLERLGVGKSIARSWRLTDGYFWRTFGAEFLVAVIVSVVGQVVTVPISLVFSIAMGFLAPTSNGELNGGAVAAAIASYALLLLVSLVIGAVTSVVQAAVVALVYLDLRMRKEGLDLELARFVEDRATGASPEDPFEPAAAPRPAAQPGSA